MDITKHFKKGRGRGVGRGHGGGRGRGRGRGFSSANKNITLIDLDDDDELCNIAFDQAELENNSITKSFETLNAASQLPGFDPMSGSIWIYPTNRPVRDYQYEIVKTALFSNTLVSLPTGLGKTFISAVVMYNFQRWYPTGIIVFMAPTRPLVTQQLDACHNTVGISPSKTVELTGQIVPKKREQLWQTKTVFFLTPQVLLSDLERNFFPVENVRCVVVDEAHKALGNHAYVQVITKIAEKNRLFRVLALTATPGSDLTAVQQVFKNLLVSKVELRSENSLDILPYIHDKKVEKIVVKLDSYLKYVHDQLMQVFQTYTGKLMKVSALSGRDGISYSKYQLLKAREKFRQDMATKLPSHKKGYIEVDYAICISLAHAIEILLGHGLRTFYIFLLGVLNKEKGTPAVTAELRKKSCLQNLLDEIQQKLNISTENSTFDFDLTNTSGLFTKVGSPTHTHNIVNRSIAQEDVDFTLSHPKLKVLKDIVNQHFLDFQYKNATTRVMIFSQYRDSVQEIGNMLNTLRPRVKPMVFIGQSNTSSVGHGRGLKQKDQVQVVQQFREGGFNVLVATSVGEEGLDIGEVDLIICFDASKSPTRLIQRMGRTGRQRDGRTVFLLTEGKEERCYATSISSHSSISKTITDPKKLQPFLYKQSPRMVPLGIDPTCYKMSIILTTEQSSQPEPVYVDLEDNDDGKSKEIPQKNKKKPTNAEKKTKINKGTNNKNLTNADVGPSKNIAKMFEQMSSAGSQEKPKIVTEAMNYPPAVGVNDDDIFFLDEGVNVFEMNNIKAFNSSSIYPKTFDIDRPGRLEWQPCTTFFKNKFPHPSAINSLASIPKLDNLLLNEKELAQVEYSLKSRESFSYSKNDFCGCGNTLEPHEVERDPITYNFTTDQIVLDQPFIEEEFSEDLPMAILEDFDKHFTPDMVVKENLLTPSPQKTVPNIFLKTPVKDSSSDDDTKSQFSASPEVGQNRFMMRLKEIKAANEVSSTYQRLHSSNEENVKQTYFNSVEETKSVSTISQKKFKFKKKTSAIMMQHTGVTTGAYKSPPRSDPLTLQDRIVPPLSPPDVTPLMQHDDLNQARQESPSPPLSPILNLPSVKNDLFNVPARLHELDETNDFEKSFTQRYQDYSTNFSSLISRNARSASFVSKVPSPYAVERNNLRKFRQKRGKVNPFIESEAEVSGEESETSFEDENEFQGLGGVDDSFVTNDDDVGVTDSQQVMYLESVKDAIPAKFGRVERPLSPKSYGTYMDTTGESYEDDSFCQGDDDVDYMDVGVFTQAMNQAKIDIAVSNSGRQTRRGKRQAIATKAPEPNQPKQRRRVVTIQDSSDEEN